MLGDLVIRPEIPSDIAGIRALTSRAFEGLAYSDGTEAEIIDRLRSAGGLAVSLAAFRSGKLVGHVAFSPAVATWDAQGWFALGPISVAPDQQRQGIGKRLIAEGLSRLQASGGKGCILVGNPAYYRQSGFALAPQYCPPTQPPDYFMIRALGEDQPCGQFEFHPAFYGNLD